MADRFLLLTGAVAMGLAFPHLLPPIESFFRAERVWLTTARVFLGVPEFFSFSLLSFLHISSPLAMFSSVVGLTVLPAAGLRRMARTKDELSDIVPSLLLIILLFGILSAYGGGTLVGPSYECFLETAPGQVQKVVTFNELGFAPGAHYFLLARYQEDASWSQRDYVRLDEPSPDPCSPDEPVFPP